MGILDNDLYQFTMSQYAWLHHRERVVRYRFRNRTFAVPLGDVLDLRELRRRLRAVSATAVADTDVSALRSLGHFHDDWLSCLATVTALPDVDIAIDHGHLDITYEGPWHLAVFLETPV